MRDPLANESATVEPSGPSLRQRLLRGGFWVVAGKVVTAGSTILIASVLAKLLPQAQLGAFFLGERLTWLVAMLALLGMNTTVVRLVAEALATGRPGRARGAIRMSYVVGAIGLGATLIALLLGGGAWLARSVWNSALLESVIPLVTLWAVLQGLMVLTSEVFRGFKDLMRATLFGGVITGPLALLMLVALWLSGAPVELRHVVTVFIAAGGLNLAAALVLVQRHVIVLGPREPLDTGEVLHISVPLWINGFMAWALTQCDLLIVQAVEGEDAVAIYGAAAKLVTLVLMSLMLVNLVVQPFIAELYARGQKERLQRILRTTATLAGLPAIGALSVYLLFGPWILQLVYHDAVYRQGFPILAMLSLARLVHVFAGSAAMTLSMTGHQRSLLRITMITSTVTVLGAILAVGPYGSIGVAAAISAGVSLQALWVWISARLQTGIWTHVTIPSIREIRELVRRES